MAVAKTRSSSRSRKAAEKAAVKDKVEAQSKDELKAEAAEHDLPVSGTKEEIAERIVHSGSVPQVRVDNLSRRSDADALEGHFCEIVAGEHKGLKGVFDKVLEAGPDGYPTLIEFITRDAQNDVLTVPYKDVRPTVYAGGR